MKDYLTFFLKGLALGTANAVPGLSGGTIAILMGVFERVLKSIKSFDFESLKLLVRGKFKEYEQHTDLFFLLTIIAGSFVGVFTLAELLKLIFENDKYKMFVWAYFFGLISFSIYIIIRRIQKWTISTIAIFIVSAICAVFIALLNPSVENNSFFYLMLCGLIMVCAMFVPGLSPSFVLILMGNFELIVIKSTSHINMTILLPVAIGGLIGFIAFSNLFTWIYKRFSNQTISLMGGFVLGSLYTLWPWKKIPPIYKTAILPDGTSTEVLDKNGNPIVLGYERYFPTSINKELLIAIGIILLGVITVWVIYKLSEKPPEPEPTPVYTIEL